MVCDEKESEAVSFWFTYFSFGPILRTHYAKTMGIFYLSLMKTPYGTYGLYAEAMVSNIKLNN